MRASLRYKLNLDTFGTLREFFSQFDLIARTNCWSETTKTIALALCLRGKARTVLEMVENLENLEYAKLK